jgi:hypothetical protein
VIVDRKIALIVDSGGFMLVTLDQLGNRGTIFTSVDLEETLRMGAQILGYSLVLPISGAGAYCQLCGAENRPE